MSELKPCPFCGGKVNAVLSVRKDEYGVIGKSIECVHCGATMESVCEYIGGGEYIANDTTINNCLTDVVERWNTRASNQRGER